MNRNEKRISEIKQELQSLGEQKTDLLSELSRLESLVHDVDTQFTGSPFLPEPPKTPEEKIKLFISLFRCRSDVFPKYWKNSKNGKKGYSPVCSNEWKNNICYKPKIKCTACSNQAFVPFDQNIAKDHLTGKIAIGSYAINQQDKCCFLAADFDKSSWKDDITAYQKAATSLQIQVGIEISKSGNGAHGWIFFDSPVSATKARKLGDLILSKAMDQMHSLNLDSYDRFFPNQDYLPSGGFGNLIALPLQRNYRDDQRSVFVDYKFEPIQDQWEYLSSIHRLSTQDLDNILNENLFSLEYMNSPNLGEHNISNAIRTAEEILNSNSDPEEQFSGEIEISLGGQVAIPLKEIPGSILKKLKKMGTIANPKFFEAQALRFSTWNIPKYIFCGDNDSRNIYLPRGKLNEVKLLLNKRGFNDAINDDRNLNTELPLGFSGELFGYQKVAVKSIMKHDYSVLVAPTGTGKTIMAINLITRKKMKTLILVHRSTLIDQWIDSICRFIPEIEKKNIEVLGAGRKKLKGSIDIAMLQTLANKDDLEEITTGYDFLIVDECHRIPTATFEPVLKAIKVKSILGLTATPQRKDHFQSIIFMQCGAIGHIVQDVNKKDQIRNVFLKSTEVPEINQDGTIQDLWTALISNESRNKLIVSDILELIQNRKSPLILSDRIEHIDILIEITKQKTNIPIFTLTGETGKKERKMIIEECKELFLKKDNFCLFATGSLIGEGFDLPDFDTMILTLPISFKGRLTQYVGRLHRRSTKDDTKIITIYDYVDTCSGMTISMFKKRIPAYKKLGYIFHYDLTDRISKWL